MSEDTLVFPRLIYRGAPDTLGTGQDAKGHTLDSETKRCASAEALKADLKDGWRLTRELPKTAAPVGAKPFTAAKPAKPAAAPVAAKTGDHQQPAAADHSAKK